MADIRSYLLQQLVPLWCDQGTATNGGIVEQLDRNQQPILLGYRRHLVQCRQLYLFSAAALIGGHQRFLAKADHLFEFINQYFWDAVSGGWYFKLDDQLRPLTPTKDCYSHAFMIFACAYYFAASGNRKAIEAANRTYEILEQRFKDTKAGGYFEAIDVDTQPAPRRQNPHMHLFEAALAMHSLTPESNYLNLADQLYLLFKAHFYDASTKTLREFFSDDWQYDRQTGHRIEPGHHFEWVFLLVEYHQAKQRETKIDSKTKEPDNSIIDIAEILFSFAQANGFDHRYGGIFDQVSSNGDVLKTTKRIWPQLEYIKALIARQTYLKQQDQALNQQRLQAAIAHLFTHYGLASGQWWEHLDQALSPINDRLPASTPYHLFYALRQMLEHQSS